MSRGMLRRIYRNGGPAWKESFESASPGKGCAWGRDDYAGCFAVATSPLDSPGLRKALRKTLIALAIGLGLALLLLVIVAGLAKSSPSFYRPPRLDAPDFEASAKKMEDKLIEIRNLAAEAQARGANAATRYVVTITQDELNAFVLKWTELNALRDQYERYARRPMVAFEPGKVIFAAEATVGPVDCVVSLYTNLSREGEHMKLSIEKLQAGRLTIPESAWRGQTQRLIDELQRQLPAWQSSARFDRAGTANESAAKAVYGQLLLAALKNEPADTRAVIPVSSGKGIAMRIVDLNAGHGELTLTLKPLNAGERDAFLADLKAPN